jgi:hypothetical protein
MYMFWFSKRHESFHFPCMQEESKVGLQKLLEEHPSVSEGGAFRMRTRELLNDYHFPRGVRLAIHGIAEVRPK